MDVSVLTTKLYIPPLRPNLVSRPRLVERLDVGLCQGRKLSLIAAPVGFGKTTLATEWLYSKSETIAWLSLDKGDVASFVEAFSGSNRHIIDYLTEEVLAQQPQEMRDFLHQTSILERFCAPLCDALRQADADSQTLLEHLKHQSLFLVPLDDQRKWYRYHRLFAGFLRTELVPRQSAALHLQAARWFEAHDLLPEAAEHALAHAAATGDMGEAVRVVTLAGSRALSEGALVTLLGWLDALPDEVVHADDWLASFKAWCLLMTGQSDVAISYIQSAEATLERGGSPVDRGRVLALRCAVSDAEDVLRMAPQALNDRGRRSPIPHRHALHTRRCAGRSGRCGRSR